MYESMLLERIGRKGRWVGGGGGGGVVGVCT